MQFFSSERGLTQMTSPTVDINNRSTSYSLCDGQKQYASLKNDGRTQKDGEYEQYEPSLIYTQFT
jgi:hypothetical protein